MVIINCTVHNCQGFRVGPAWVATVRSSWGCLDARGSNGFTSGHSQAPRPQASTSEGVYEKGPETREQWGQRHWSSGWAGSALKGLQPVEGEEEGAMGRSACAQPLCCPHITCGTSMNPSVAVIGVMGGRFAFLVRCCPALSYNRTHSGFHFPAQSLLSDFWI